MGFSIHLEEFDKALSSIRPMRDFSARQKGAPAVSRQETQEQRKQQLPRNKEGGKCWHSRKKVAVIEETRTKSGASRGNHKKKKRSSSGRRIRPEETEAETMVVLW